MDLVKFIVPLYLEVRVCNELNEDRVLSTHLKRIRNAQSANF